MALTLEKLKSEISSSADYKDLDQKAWLEKISFRGITKYSQPDFDHLIPNYVQSINDIRRKLRETGLDIKVVPQTLDGKMKSSKEIVDEMNSQMEELQHLTEQEARLTDKLAVCLKEVEYRKDKVVVRTDLHLAADYYIDYTNGNDAHDGLKTANLTVDSTADTTHLTDAALDGADDYINGDFLWNVTRESGSLISDFDADSDTAILATAIVGMTAGDTYYIIKAWKTITKYTTDTVRTAGDNAYLRANTTWAQGTEAKDITMDENGSIDAYITIIGCDATTNDPWNDDSNVKPIIDFQDAAYQFLIARDFWKLERLDVRQSADTNGQILINARLGVIVKSCKISDSGNSSTEGIGSSGIVYIEDCEFIDCWAPAIYSSAVAYVKNCTLNAGVVRGGTYGLWCVNGYIYAENCTIGTTTAFSTKAVYCSGGGIIYLRNCPIQDSNTYGVNATTGYAVFAEDDDGTFEAQRAYYIQGEITRQTASPRDGGSDSYAKIAPNANCGLISPLILGELSGFSPIEATKDIEITITVYARVGSAWDSALAANEAYMKVSYLSNASTAARTEVTSTQTITNDGEWTAFTVQFTPLQTGLVYVWFYLAEYEDASEYIDVDDEPVKAAI